MDLEGDSYTVSHAWVKPCTKKASNKVFKTETFQWPMLSALGLIKYKLGAVKELLIIDIYRFHNKARTPIHPHRI